MKRVCNFRITVQTAFAFTEQTANLAYMLQSSACNRKNAAQILQKSI